MPTTILSCVSIAIPSGGPHSYAVVMWRPIRAIWVESIQPTFGGWSSLSTVWPKPLGERCAVPDGSQELPDPFPRAFFPRRSDETGFA